jgi:energy-coupling factor transport system ATP-binding protein
VTGIRVQELVHVYPSGVRALEGVDLAIPAGQALALVGENGSGKTTLVRHLNGLLRPTAGRVLLDDEDCAARRVAELATLVALSFQDPAEQIFAGAVHDEVAFGPRSLGRPAEEVERAVERALERTGLLADAARNPGDLGHSRRKLLSIAAVLAMETPVVVLDEPTTGQDARGLERVQAIVSELGGEGRTVIAVTHDLRFAAESFERVVVMRAGRAILDGAPAEVFAVDRWALLREAALEPTYAARVGARMDLGSTPSDAVLIARMATGPIRGRHPGAT